MPNYDLILDDFTNGLPEHIAKPEYKGPAELQAALNAVWSEMWGVVDKAGRLAKEKYGEDLYIGTQHRGFDIPSQTQKAALTMRRPGVPSVEILFTATTEYVEINGKRYGPADKEQLVSTLLDRIKQWLEQPLA